MSPITEAEHHVADLPEAGWSEILATRDLYHSHGAEALSAAQGQDACSDSTAPVLARTSSTPADQARRLLPVLETEQELRAAMENRLCPGWREPPGRNAPSA